MIKYIKLIGKSHGEVNNRIMTTILNIPENTNMQNTQQNRRELQERLHGEIEVRRQVRLGNPGHATMQSIVNNARTSGYNKRSAMGDILDESILNCKKNGGNCLIQLFKEPLTEDRLYKMIISDDIANGFQGIDINGPENPLCAIMQRVARHGRDDEWSQFGQGFTSASMTVAGKLSIVTKFLTINGTMDFMTAICDWSDMAQNNTTMPQPQVLSQENYSNIHPFDNGTTLIYERCRDEIFDDTMANDVNSILTYVKTVYSKAIASANENRENSCVTLKVFDGQGNLQEEKFVH